MLFNSHAFILVFLPVTWVLHNVLVRTGPGRSAHAFLVLASLAFYGWWSVRGLTLLLVLMGANYALVLWLVRHPASPGPTRRLVLMAGLAGNLGVLGYFKYTNFLLENWAMVTGAPHHALAVALPLGISFFTFQKVALLIDAHRGRVASLDPLGFLLFVTFFPQLIAGPIVHHAEVMPQFGRRTPPGTAEINAGLALFAIGLAKKVLLADTAATWATPVFDGAADGVPSAADAWGGALAYTLQLYFDFSGYSDMALGAALLFGIRLPANFDSPYKAASIAEFWRRWHMTLSRFLRDYLYIPLGGSRRGVARHGLNLLLTMALGGLWHGAGWTFLVWGTLHGVWLILNHGWRTLRQRRGWRGDRFGLARRAAQAATFLAVTVGWVFFRSPDLSTAFSMLKGMMGQGGGADGTIDSLAARALATMLGIVWLAPNSLELTARALAPAAGGVGSAARSPMRSGAFACACGLLLAAALMSLNRVSEFLYFQF